MYGISAVARSVSNCSVHFVQPYDMTEEIDGLQVSGYLVAEITASRIPDKLRLIDEISRSLKFPEYCGRNLDALEDCLRDLDDRYSGYLLLIRESEDFWSTNTNLAMTLTSIWLNCSDYWIELDKPFNLFFC